VAGLSNAPISRKSKVKYPKLSGLYRITNLRNGKFYIGSAENLFKRCQNHFRELARGTNKCRILQNAYSAEENKSVFIFEIFMLCKTEELRVFEQKYIDSEKPPYNASKFADRVEWTADLRKRMSDRYSGEKSVTAKLSEADVIWIRTSPESHASVAERFNMNYHHIRAIRYGQYWTHIPLSTDAMIDHWEQLGKIRDINFRNARRKERAKITEETAQAILDATGTNASIAEKFGVTYNTVNAIRARRSWVNLKPRGL
jgi:group I intron endonuclease